MPASAPRPTLHQLLVVASMFHFRLMFISLDTGRIQHVLRLGGRIKSIGVGPGDDVFVSSTCGTFLVDLDTALGSDTRLE